MNSDLLNIISTGDNEGRPPSSFHDDGVDDILSPRPRSLEDKAKSSSTNYFGLNLGRSQSAAPETWEYGKSSIPSSTKSAHHSNVSSGLDSEIFGRSRFFDEEEEDREALMQAATRRPASTGVIGRPSAGSEGDVNSILETLGLTSLEDTSDTQRNSNMPSPYTPQKALGGIDSAGSLVMGAHSTSKKSIMEKNFGGDLNNGSNLFGSESNSSNVFSNNPGGGLQNVSAHSQQYNQFEQQQQGLQGLGQQQAHSSQYVQQSQTNQLRQGHLNQDQLHYDPQQQVYYQQAAPAPSYHTQDYRAQQQQANMQMHGAIPGQQQAVYINAPAQSYGYDYHAPQQHIQHGVPANHIIMPQQVHGQPQYISVLPLQAGPHVIGGAPQYAYVQYGDGMAQPTLVAGGAAYVMGPNGPIAVANPPGVVPIGAMNYGGHGSSPPGGGRSPIRSSNGMRSPDRMSRKKNPLSSPRNKRMDKNASTPSKLGPEAANLLNEIRAAKSRNQWTIHDIKGHVVEFCLDQNGSRFIQQRLEVAAPEEKDSVMDEIVPAIKELQNDVFGNYVVQKLYEFGTEKMKRDLKGTLEGNMLMLSLQMYGCRVVQKALESLAYEDLCELLQEFDCYVLTCIQDQNGNHVMQKCIEIMSIKAKEAEAMTGEVGLSVAMSEKIQFVVDDVLANVRTLCCHPYGCRVLQRMLEHCVPHQKIATLDKIQLVHKALLDDQYGNYVIQHVLQYGRDVDRDSLLKIITENDLLKLSRQKFASNVVEKLLKYGNSSQRNSIVREMLKVVADGTSQEGVGSSVLLLMVRDAYANYVVQTAIDVVPEGNEKRMLLEELKANEVQLRNYTFAKHIVAKIGTK